MAKKRCAVLLFAIACSMAMAAMDAVTVTSLHRNVVLVGEVEKVRLVFDLKNTGAQEERFFHLALAETEADRLSYAVLLRKPSDLKEFTPFQAVEGASPNQLRALLPAPIAPGATTTVEIRVTMTHPTVPLPRQVTQYDDAYAKYVFSTTYYSPYFIQEQTTDIDLGTTTIDTFPKGATVKGRRISLSSVRDTKPFVWSPVATRFKPETAYMTMTSATREIEVSHWGNIAYSEQYELQNSIAGFTGSFSRLDFEAGKRFGEKKAEQFEHVYALLPPTAYAISYRDNLGNVSSSEVRRSSKMTTLDMRLRFPLVPSWRTDIELGYNTPSQESLFYDKSSGSYVLKAKLGIPIKGAVTDDLTVRIIMPEGASDYDISLPCAVESVDYSWRYTYLDTTGRPMIEVKLKNATPFHNRLIEVRYKFPRFFILREPLYLIAGFLVFFLAILAHSKIDFRLSNNNRAVAYSENRRPNKSNSDSVISKLIHAHKLLVAAYKDASRDSSEYYGKVVDLLSRMADEEKRPKVKNVVEQIRTEQKTLKMAMKKEGGARTKATKAVLNHVQDLLDQLQQQMQ